MRIFQPFVPTTIIIFCLSLGDRCFLDIQEGIIPPLWAYLFQRRWTKWNNKKGYFKVQITNETGTLERLEYKHKRQEFYKLTQAGCSVQQGQHEKKKKMVII